MSDLAPYLRPTFFIDSDAPAVAAFAREVTAGAADDRERAVRLFYAVRDRIRYNPYGADLSGEQMRASVTLARGEGFCIPKAVLLCAAARAVSLPARLGFADVRNHLTTARLREQMQTDLFVYHGFCELLVEDRWLKVTPTFNLSLCERFGVLPLEFDGARDCLLQPVDQEGNQHMEYVLDRGHAADVPLAEILAVWQEHYPRFFGDGAPGGDFEAEAASEAARS